MNSEFNGLAILKRRVSRDLRMIFFLNLSKLNLPYEYSTNKQSEVEDLFFHLAINELIRNEQSENELVIHSRNVVIRFFSSIRAKPHVGVSRC